MCGEIVAEDTGGTTTAISADNANAYDDAGDNANNIDDGLPYACHICRQPFTNPIVTSCQHYFCEGCMLHRIRDESTTACPICQKDTHGVFNHARKLEAKKRRLVGREGTWEAFMEKGRRGRAGGVGGDQ